MDSVMKKNIPLITYSPGIMQEFEINRKIYQGMDINIGLQEDLGFCSEIQKQNIRLLGNWGVSQIFYIFEKSLEIF